jgi:hypothetical protein
MNHELHENPAMGHKKKGSEAMAKGKMEHMRISPSENGGHSIEHHYKSSMGKSGAFLSHPEPETHVFGAHEGAKMIKHIKEHLGLGAKPEEHAPAETEEPEEGE